MNQTSKELLVLPYPLSIKETIPIYKKMLSKNPESFVFLPLAELYRRQGQAEEAIRLCQEGLKKHPHYHSARVSLAMAYYHNLMSKEAIEELLQVVEVHPENLLAQRMLALLFLNTDKVNEAIERFEIVRSLNPYDNGLKTLIDELKRKVNSKLAESADEKEPFGAMEIIPEEVEKPETTSVPQLSSESINPLELKFVTEIPLPENKDLSLEDSTLREGQSESEVAYALPDEEAPDTINAVAETARVTEEVVPDEHSETTAETLIVVEPQDAPLAEPSEISLNLVLTENREDSTDPNLILPIQEEKDHELTVSDLTSPHSEIGPEEGGLSGEIREAAKKTLESWLQNIKKSKENPKTK